jgi:hypothetical protein
MSERHKLYERIGSFTLRKADLDALPDWLQQMMTRVIVVKAGYAIEEDGITYTALCPDFEPYGRGGWLTRYEPVIEDGRFLRFEARW